MIKASSTVHWYHIKSKVDFNTFILSVESVKD